MPRRAPSIGSYTSDPKLGRRFRPQSISVPSGAGGFNPKSITTLIHWHDFADQSTLFTDLGTTGVTADADPIRQANDKSGNGFHVTNAGGTVRPFYKTGIQNGRSIARFDGNDDILKVTGLTGDTSYTVFLALQKRSAPGAGTTVAFGLSTISELICASGSDATHYNWFANEANGIQTNVGGTAASFNIMVIKVTSAASVSFYANGGSATATFDPNNAITTDTGLVYGARFDAAQFGDFDIGECLRYDSTFTNAQLDLVGNYLAGKWGTTWTAAA